MRNPMATAVWVDFQVHQHNDSPVLAIGSAGRAGDGDVLTRNLGGVLNPLLKTPMWVPEEGDAWMLWCEEHEPDIDTLWAERERQIARRDQYLCPPLGQFYPPAPDLSSASWDTPLLVDEIVLATDGAGLDGKVLPLSGVELGSWLAARLTLPWKWSVPDIAALCVRPAI
jgi:hypothetical protein